MSVNVIDTIKPKNGGSFPVAEGADIALGAQRLPEVLSGKASVESVEAVSNAVKSKASQEAVNNIAVALSTKADQSELNETKVAVSTKAEQHEVDVLSATVDTKATQAELDRTTANLQSQIDNIVTPVTQDAEVENARIGADGASYSSLKERLDSNENSVNTIADNIPTGLELERKTINTEGVVSASTTRTLSKVFYVEADTVFKVKPGYQFRCARYTSSSESSFQMISEWITEIEFTTAGYRRFVFAKFDMSRELTPTETRQAISEDTTVDYPEVYILESDIDDINENISNINADIPEGMKLERKTLNTYGVVSDSTTRTLSEIVLVPGDTVIKVKSGYQFRYARYESESEDSFQMISDWETEQAFTTTAYRRFVFAKMNSVEELTPAETRKALTEDTNIPFPQYSTLKSDISDIEEVIGALKKGTKYDNMNLNVPLTGRNNEIWSYTLSIYPLCQAFKRVRNCVYWGYTTSEGYSGVACYNIDEKTFKKTHLKKFDVDDHNPCAVHIRANGDIIAAYSGGHNTDKMLHIRKSEVPECIDSFDDDRAIYIGYPTTYSQIFEYDDMIWVFLRFDTNNWGCVTSSDGGATWSELKPIISSTQQYYCKFQKTNTDGLLRMCMYSNPDGTDTNIRMGFLDLGTGKIYNYDNVQELGTVGVAVSSGNFNVIVQAPAEGKQRLLDVAVTNANDIVLLFAQWTTNSDGVYKLYNSGSISNICNCGTALWVDKYQGGAAFVTDDTIVLSRGALGIEYIELWDISSAPVLSKEIYKEEKGLIPIRNARPIVSSDGSALLWHRGFYNSSTYTDFNTDAMLYFVDDEEIIM